MSRRSRQAERLGIAPGLRLQWEARQGCHVLLYPEGMVRLNDSAAAILLACDGARSAGEVVAQLQRDYPDADLADDVHAFLDDALAKGWIRARD